MTAPTLISPPRPAEEPALGSSIAFHDEGESGRDRSRAPSSPLVRPFEEIGRSDIASVGGKGANLGELTRAMLPVPRGFVVTTDAYGRFLAADALGERVSAALAELDVDDPPALQACAERVRTMVREAAIPGEVRDAVTEAYRSLTSTSRGGTPFVAVRSSATAEDTGQFSFAGMFESFLNVRGDEDLLRALRDCWASTFGARVLFYRVKQGLPREMAIAVVVQTMIDSEKSGVMFTVDPATHDERRMVIEAAWGLGEVVVGGQVTPDRYVVDKSALQLVEKAVARKTFLLTRDPVSGDNVKVDLENDPRGTAQVLTDAELRRIAELGRRTESHYGVPQDIEFAIARGEVFLTQSRPITTLAAKAIPASAAAPAGTVLARGLGASPGVAGGAVRVLASVAEGGTLAPGEIPLPR
jgi:pyruvate,water dikinase